MSEPLVVLEGVNKWFGDLHVLKDVNQTIRRGEVVVVIGPSGSGKSTLCRTINRLETIDQGSISLDGQPLPDEGKQLAALRAEVGMVFQSFNLFAHKTILENVTMGPIKVRKQKPAEAAPWFLKNYQADKQGARAPDSLLYLAESMIVQKDTKRACIALAEFGETYPAVASGRLKSQYDADRGKVKCN